jgi:hypothetical protein
MKKMNKMYQAPVAEMVEMQMPIVLMVSPNVGGQDPGNSPNPGSNPWT